MQGIVQEKRIFVEEISIKNCSLQVGPNAFAKLPLKQLNLQNLGGLNLQTNSLHFKGTCLVGLLVCVETFVITVTARTFPARLHVVWRARMCFHLYLDQVLKLQLFVVATSPNPRPPKKVHEF